MDITIIVGKDMNEHLHSYSVHPSQRTIMDISILFGVMNVGKTFQKENTHSGRWPSASTTIMDITILIVYIPIHGHE